jgi:hypothetical protein
VRGRGDPKFALTAEARKARSGPDSFREFGPHRVKSNAILARAPLLAVDLVAKARNRWARCKPLPYNGCAKQGVWISCFLPAPATVIGFTQLPGIHRRLKCNREPASVKYRRGIMGGITTRPAMKELA